MSELITKKFWIDAADRSIKTGAQFVLTVLGLGFATNPISTETAQTLNAFAFDYRTLIGAGLAGGLISLLTSLASLKVGEDGTASLLKQ